MTAPLPIPRQNNHASRPLVGLWRAFVERETTPVAVSIPELYGAGRVIPDVEVIVEVTALVPLARGERVWVAGVDGTSTQFVIVGRRG